MKKCLIFGLSITGVSAVKALSRLGWDLTILDSRTEQELEKTIEGLKAYENLKYHLGENDIDLEGFDLLLKSPGIKPSLAIFDKAKELGIEVVSDLELAYRISNTKHIIAVSGTNGKTTVVSLIAEILKTAGKKTQLVGNIGVGMLDYIFESKEDDYFVIETSSFQLEHTSTFKPEASLITNITPDHIDWHGSFEAYANAKRKILNNQGEGDITVINIDDQYLSQMEINNGARLIKTSKEKINSDGAFVQNGKIFVSNNGHNIEIMDVSDIKLLGSHNLENVLSAVALTYFIGIEPEKIKVAVSNFKGVEHRIEFVRDIGGVKFYNDSKGTNPESTIKAIEAVEAPIILIGGGYDKEANFDELSEHYHKKVYLLILMGATRDKMRASALRSSFTNIELVDNMEEAVKLAFYSSESGTNVLLSPACASWGMYNNFEERGRDFKAIVGHLKERI
ncbi:MAG: UDP-N-acetylmuramoyl-L-alanine--D-glutamate ligase [Tissierellia bacterium]|nr:UDP-N-acetylmuramoyl-L-alanine--D-glutamate ligase [Tissierellia bacterium]